MTRPELRSGIAPAPIPLEDADLPTPFSISGFDLGRLRDRRVVNVLIGVAVACAIVLWPERTDRVLVRLVGAGVAGASVSAVWTALTASPRRWAGAAVGVAGVALGATLVAFPDRSIVTVGRLLALALIAASCAELASTRRKPADDRTWAWPIAKAAAGLATAALIAGYPTTLLAFATAALALAWAVVGSLAIVQSVSTRDDRMWRYADTGDFVVAWLDARPKDADDRELLYEKVLFEGEDTRRRFIRFATLMSFAGVIAAMGVITDSTAVVIGAMLVAPLMTPLMGMAVSTVMGWPNRLTRHAAIALFGVVLSIAIGVALGLIAPTAIDPATNQQIIARSTPTILDLMTAVAAGGAGAYGLSRPDVSDALPGVAIAISLVPPLSVVGIAWSQGAWADGNGALLLFTTNALAIIVVGGATFVVTGVTPIRRVAGNQQRVRTAVASIVALGAFVVGALTINGGEATSRAFETGSVERVTSDWADDSEALTFVQATIIGDRVTAVLLGPSADPPATEELHALLVEELGRNITLDVRLLIEEKSVFSGE